MAKHVTLFEPYTIGALIFTIISWLLLGMCVPEFKIDYNIDLLNSYTKSTKQSIRFESWKGCKDNRVSRQIKIIRKISFMSGQDEMRSIPQKILDKITGDIYQKLKVQENAEFGVEEIYIAEASSDCSVPRVCYIVETSRDGIIKFGVEGRSKSEAKFLVPVHASLSCKED